MPAPPPAIRFVAALAGFFWPEPVMDFADMVGGGWERDGARPGWERGACEMEGRCCWSGAGFGGGVPRSWGCV